MFGDFWSFFLRTENLYVGTGIHRLIAGKALYAKFLHQLDQSQTFGLPIAYGGLGGHHGGVHLDGGMSELAA